jgi:phosphoglycolate phosphatase
VCGDEHKDFVAAISTGMHPFMVSYGFESHGRLTDKFDVPDDIIARTPGELCKRVVHALDLGQRPSAPARRARAAQLNGERERA